MRLGPTELLIILTLILVMFGGRKLPELAKGLGQGLREFKSAVKEDKAAEELPAEE
jgi:sec-independent protein translocase protein TatA